MSLRLGRTGKNAKEFRATMGRKPIVGIFSVGLEEPYRWKDSVQNAAEISALGRGWRGERFASLVYEILRQAPRRALARAGCADVSALCELGEISAQRATARAGGCGLFATDRLVLRRQGRRPYSRLVPGPIEARMPFEMVHDRLLDAGACRGFKTLILPNVAALSDATMRSTARLRANAVAA